MAKRTIYLNEENDNRWKKLFDETGRNASEWIADKLEEEETVNSNPFFLNKRILELKENMFLLQQQLEDAQNRLKNVSTIKKPAAMEFTMDFVLLRNMTKGIVQTYGLESTTAQRIAKEYLTLGEEKPILQEFMRQKMKNGEVGNVETY